MAKNFVINFIELIIQVQEKVFYNITLFHICT